MDKFLNDLLSSLQSYYDSLIDLFPKLGLGFIVFFILLFIANRARHIVSTRLSTRMDDPLLARFLGTVVKTAIVLFALLLFLRIIGLGYIATGLLSGAGVSAFIIGFAFKDIGENFLAGILMAFDRPFNIGDTVELGGKEGKVIALNLRNTQIKSPDGKDIFIPNANIIKSTVTNYTIDGFLRYSFNIGLANYSDVNKASKIILDTLKTIPQILQEGKPPSVSTGILTNRTLTITAYYWLNTYDLTISTEEVETIVADRVLTNLETGGF